MSENVPEEPAADCVDKICTLRLRYPDGEVGQRKFLASHTLGVSCLLPGLAHLVAGGDYSHYSGMRVAFSIDLSVYNVISSASV